MRTREFPVLSDEDEPLVSRLSLGLGDEAAQVLSYLLRRDEDPTITDEPAVRLAIRVGTDVNSSAVSDALDRLESRGLVTATTADSDQGRPPKAWVPREGASETTRRVDEKHAEALLRQATSVAEELGTVDRRDEPTDRTTPESDEFRVGLNWFPNALHAPLFAARGEGHYGDRGLDVTFRSFRGSDRALEALENGEADVAVAGAATVARQRAAGSPLVPIAQLYQRSMTVLYTTRDAFGGPLDDIESVRGRRVGMPIGAETGVLGRLFLSQSNIIDEVTLVDLSGEEGDALATGRADVVTGTIRDPRELAATGADVDVLPVANRFPLYGPTLVTTERNVRDRREALVAFLAGTVAGWGDAVTDPAAAIRHVEDRDGPPISQAVSEFEHVVDRFGTSTAVTDHGWGWHDASGWRRLSTALAQADLLEEAET